MQIKMYPKFNKICDVKQEPFMINFFFSGPYFSIPKQTPKTMKELLISHVVQL